MCVAKFNRLCLVCDFLQRKRPEADADVTSDSVVCQWDLVALPASQRPKR